MKKYLSVIFVLTMLWVGAQNQWKEYDFERKISNVDQTWNQILLPDEIFSKMKNYPSDIRIYGITPNKDTVETAYVWNSVADQVSRVEVPYKQINTSQNASGFYYTFEITGNEVINEIQLETARQNFDWNVQLEGSNNQQEWFTILDNYRILSIENGFTQYQFTRLNFPDSKYRYYRLLIKSKEDPMLESAKIEQNRMIKGDYKDYEIEEIEYSENKELKQSIWEITLKNEVPVSRIKIDFKDKFDYYRPYQLKYLRDSVKTRNGWRPNYSILQSGILSSFEKNEFDFNSELSKRLRLVVENQDNPTLHLDSLIISGLEYSLIGRFVEEGQYFLAYGNPNMRNPNYEIANFTDKIPDSINRVQLGKEIAIDKPHEDKKEPLFNNKLWLWMLMIAIIIILGLFSMKMLKSGPSTGSDTGTSAGSDTGTSAG